MLDGARFWLAVLELRCDVPLTRFINSERPSPGLGPGESTASESTLDLCCLRDLDWPFRGAGSSLVLRVLRMARLLIKSSSSWTFVSSSAYRSISLYSWSRRCSWSD